MAKRFPKTETEQDWIKVRTVESDTGCWEWQAYRDADGYGDCGGSLISKKYKTARAHRISYLVFNGPIEEDLVVCHRCDNPSCLNPEHLWTGTAQENTKDRDIKGRNKPVKGEAHCRAKLTTAQVLEIRKTPNQNREALAAKYQVSQRTITDIWVRKSWKHI